MGSSHRIVVGREDSAAGVAALRWAVAEAEADEAHVVVLSTLDRPGESGSLDGDPDADRHRRDERYRTQAWVVEVLREVTSKVPVLVSTTEGRLELALAGAGSRADLVVFGHDPDGEGALQADVLSRFCPCPVVRVDPRQVAEVL